MPAPREPAGDSQARERLDPVGAFAGRRLSAWIESSWRLPVLSGVLLAVGHYGGLLLPNLVAFVPLLLWIDARSNRPAKVVARGALTFGLVAYAIGLHWIYAMLSISWLASLMFVGLLIELTAGAVAALTLAAWLRARTRWSWGLLLPIVWLPFEWLRNWTDLRLTVDHVCHGLAPFPFLVQFADVVGPYGVGAWLLAVNGLLLELLRPAARRRGASVAALAALVGMVLAYDAWAWTHPPQPTRRVKVGIVQPNIPLAVKWDAAADARQDALLAELTRRAAARGAELIVWPESARPRAIRHLLSDPATLVMPEVQALAVELGVDILTGVEYWRGLSREDRSYYNAALVARRDGSVGPDWTAKRYLVPFTEGVPFRSIVGPLVEGRGGEFHWLSGGFTPGPDTQPLVAAGIDVGVLVCYEEFYFDLARRLRLSGAELMVVVTNDAWFGRTVFQTLMADVVRLRAIETRSTIVRAANTGISGFVDPLGRYHHRTGWFVEAVEVMEVPVTTGRTLYVRLGDVAAWAAIAALLASLGVAVLRPRSRDRVAPTVE